MLGDILQGSLEPCFDQRGAERHVLRFAAAIGARPRHRITVHNLSRTGLLVASEVALAKGERIVVEFVGGARYDAEVVWADDKLFGCRFAEPLSKGSLSAALLRAPPGTSPPYGEERGAPPVVRPGALELRTKVAIVGTLALASWACLASTTYFLVW